MYEVKLATIAVFLECHSACWSWSCGELQLCVSFIAEPFLPGANEALSGAAAHGAGRGTSAYKPAGPWVDDLRKGSAATWETRPRLGPSSNQYRNQEGSGRGSSLPQAPVNSAPQRRLREGAPTAEKARASAWGSLSQILAAPGKIVSPPPPSPLREEPKVCVSATQCDVLFLSLFKLCRTLYWCVNMILNS